MSSEVAISVQNVSKVYHIYQHPRDLLVRQVYTQLESLPLLPDFLKSRWQQRAARYGKEFYALRDISFEVMKGDSFGIIGRNGSGKSTLLQIIAGTLTPTQGDTTVKGRVAALLELGSGFNPEFTGRENVYLNGAILGISPEEMKVKFDSIAGFAEIGEFLDQPVKTYSAGMLLRLAFAVQINIEPDILIIDEALSVGDIFFAQKCAARLVELQARGTTLLFVSHDMALVRDLCKRAILLDKGSLVLNGPSDKTISHYFQSGSSEAGSMGPSASVGSENDQFFENFKAKSCWITEQPEGSQSRDTRIIAIASLDCEGRPSLSTCLGKEMLFQVLFHSLASRPIHVSIAIKNRYDQMIFSGGSYTAGLEPVILREGRYGLFELKVKCMIEAGYYTFKFSLGSPGSDVNRGTQLDETPWLGPLRIQWEYETQKAPFLGMFGLPTIARFRSMEGA